MDVMLLVTRMPALRSYQQPTIRQRRGRLDESGENHAELGRAYRQPGICPLGKLIERSNANR
jgi:hypothetical protein